MTSVVPHLHERDHDVLEKRPKENPGESLSAAHFLSLVKTETKKRRPKWLEQRNWGPPLGARLGYAVRVWCFEPLSKSETIA